MTEAKTDKKEEFKNRYATLCASAGELQYRIKQGQKELEQVNAEIEQLNRDFAELLKEEQEGKENAEKAS